MLSADGKNSYSSVRRTLLGLPRPARQRAERQQRFDRRDLLAGADEFGVDDIQAIDLAGDVTRKIAVGNLFDFVVRWLIFELQ